MTEAENGLKDFSKYYNRAEYSSVCINEFGEEGYINDFGTKRYPIEQILTQRLERGLMVFGTTNLDLGDKEDSDIKTKYGSRLFSKLHETNYIDLVPIVDNKVVDFRIRQ